MWVIIVDEFIEILFTMTSISQKFFFFQNFVMVSHYLTKILAPLFNA